jgi:hypothetical protein
MAARRPAVRRQHHRRHLRGGAEPAIGYRLAHPRGGNPLIVLGHYEVTSGGCDTIRVADGGTQGIIRRAQEYASSGYDVVMEGLRLSSEVERSAKLAQSHGLHILRLSTPFDDCVRNLIARRRARRDTWTSIERSTAIEHRKVEDACEHLRAQASVEVLCFDEAFAGALELLTVRN